MLSGIDLVTTCELDGDEAPGSCCARDEDGSDDEKVGVESDNEGVDVGGLIGAVSTGRLSGIVCEEDDDREDEGEDVRPG